MKIIRENLGCKQVEKELEVVNMFKLDFTRKRNDLYDVCVEFIKNGNFYVQTTFCSINHEQIEEIQKKLSDNTTYNLSVESLCEAVTWLDMIAMCKTV